MLPPEKNDGNIEYKRYLLIKLNDQSIFKLNKENKKNSLYNSPPSEEFPSLSKITESEISEYSFELKLKKNLRFQQLTTQMKYRINEGDGTAIYYIGVNDDGSFYKLSNYERSNSIKILKIMTKYLKVVIFNIFLEEDFIKVIIKDLTYGNQVMNFKEKNILLLGDTQSGKTTFLSYLIKNKLDTENSKARLHILNHKHEIESGNTSSFTYEYLSFNNIKYVFIDTPGNDYSKDGNTNSMKSIKKRNKLLLSYKFDFVIFFDKPNELWSKKNMYIEFCKYSKIPFFTLNLFQEDNFVNLVNPIERDLLVEFLIGQIHSTKLDEKIHNENTLEVDFLNDMDIFRKKVILNFISSYSHQDLGLILSGFLESGTINVGDKLYCYLDQTENFDNFINLLKKPHQVKIKSIHKDGKSISRVDSPSTITVTLENLEIDLLNSKSINSFGDLPKLIKLKDSQINFLSNFSFKPKNKFKLEWIYSTNVNESKDKLLITIRNQIVLLVKNVDEFNDEYYYSIKKRNDNMDSSEQINESFSFLCNVEEKLFICEMKDFSGFGIIKSS